MYATDDLEALKIKELKAIAAERGIVPTANKSLRQTWIDAILADRVVAVESQPSLEGASKNIEQVEVELPTAESFQADIEAAPAVSDEFPVTAPVDAIEPLASRSIASSPALVAIVFVVGLMAIAGLIVGPIKSVAGYIPSVASRLQAMRPRIDGRSPSADGSDLIPCAIG